MLFEKTIVEEIIKLWRCTMFENPKKCLIWIITSNWNLDFMLIFSAKNIYFAGKYKDHLARKYCEMRLFEWFSTILRNDSLGKWLNWLLSLCIIWADLEAHNLFVYLSDWAIIESVCWDGLTETTQFSLFLCLWQKRWSSICVYWQTILCSCQLSEWLNFWME